MMAPAWLRRPIPGKDVMSWQTIASLSRIPPRYKGADNDERSSGGIVEHTDFEFRNRLRAFGKQTL
jgi:hypothetical protein